MRVEPAGIEQLRQARDGRWVLIDAKVSTVAADLQRIDKGLKIRFAENGQPPFWAVYHESEDQRETHLVLTAQAYQTNSGTWAGLDDRIVRRIEQIDPHGRSGYEYAKELERTTLEQRRKLKAQAAEKAGEVGEQIAHAIRKDLGERYRGRTFVPKEIP